MEPEEPSAESAPASEEGRLEISCRGCGATLVVGARERTAQCPYCASPSIVERPPSPDRPDPAFVVGFVVDQERATRSVAGWIRSRGLFARSDFKKASVEVTRGVYLPAYLYGAIAWSRYQAEIGENYTVTETYTTTDSKGRTRTRTRTRTKTEWRQLEGPHASYVLDVLVTASRGIGNEALEEIEPFDLRALRRYSPALLSGWMAEDPSLAREECLELARGESRERIEGDIEAFLPGNKHRDLRVATELEDEVIDLVLLPIWSFAARYHEKRPPVRILVNGQTGEVAGRVPISAWKVGLAVAAALLLVLVIVLLAGLGR